MEKQLLLFDKTTFMDQFCGYTMYRCVKCGSSGSTPGYKVWDKCPFCRSELREIRDDPRKFDNKRLDAIKNRFSI
jgi:hypothetical protein